jgi:outer membrane protein assembly factor BamE (lipoprotein component of BamABCDE complex)
MKSSPMKFFRPCFVLALLALVGAVLPGCVINSENTTKIEGKSVDAETFAQIQPGQTKQFVVNLLGEPSHTLPPAAGAEVCQWQYTETKSSHGSIIFLINSENKTITEKSVSVEFKDGLVTRAWQD